MTGTVELYMYIKLDNTYFRKIFNTNHDSVSSGISSRGLKCKFWKHQFCRGTGKIDADGNFTAIAPHNHLPKRDDLAQFRSILTARSANEPIGIRAIYDEEARRNPDQAINYPFPRAENAMRASRRKMTPPIPSTLGDLGTLLDGDLGDRYICHSRISKVLITDNGTALFFFCEELVNSAVAGLDEIHLDGTFKVVPNNPRMRHLLTLHGIIQNTSVVLMYVLMSSRSHGAYTDVFSFIKNIVPTLQPSIIITDYEVALQRSLSEAWPDSDVRGCFFHFCQAVWRKMKKLGFLNVVNNNASALKTVKMIMVLTLLPAQNIQAGLDAVRAFTSENNVLMESFLNYISRYWIRRVGPARVSVHGIPRRTNNNIESFHNKLKLKFGVAHPNVWRFIGEILKFIKDDHILLSQLMNGVQARRPSRICYVRNNFNLNHVQEELALGQISVIEFLSRASHATDALENQLRTWQNNIENQDDSFDDLHQDEDIQEIVDGNLHQDGDIQEIVGGNLHQDEDIQEIVVENLHQDEDIQEIVDGNLHQDEDIQEIVDGNLHQDEDIQEIVDGNLHQDEDIQGIVVGNPLEDGDIHDIVDRNLHQDEDLQEIVDGNPHQDGDIQEIVDRTIHRIEQMRENDLDMEQLLDGNTSEQNNPDNSMEQLNTSEQDRERARLATCVICLNNTRTHLLRDCNHLIACDSCIRRFSKTTRRSRRTVQTLEDDGKIHTCPQCRKTITLSPLRVFM